MNEQWRVGHRLGRTLYVGDQVVGMVDTPELAAQIVAAMNHRAGYEISKDEPFDEAAEREAFEKWWKKIYGEFPDRSDDKDSDEEGEYVGLSVSHKWEGWLARAKIAEGAK